MGTKISAFPAASSVAPTDVLLGDVGGVTKKIPISLLPGGGGGISGLTANSIPKALTATTIGNSRITDDGTFIDIGDDPNFRIRIDEFGVTKTIKIGDVAAGSSLIEIDSNGSVFLGDADVDSLAAIELDLVNHLVSISSLPARLVLDSAAQTVALTALNGATLNGSQLATRAYADSLVVGLLDDRGNYNASVNTFPASGGSGAAGAVLKGDLWTVSVAGTLGGHPVTAGDVVRALVDTPGQTDGNWAITENNFGYVAENSANKVTAFSSPTDVQYPSAKLVSDQLALKANSASLATVATSGSAADLTAGILPTARGGTGIAFFTAAGPTVARVYTFPDAAATIARTDAAQTFTGIQTFADRLRGPDGTAGAPTYSFTNQTDMGMTNTTGGILGFYVGGSRVFDIRGSGAIFIPNNGATLSFGSSADLKLSWKAAANLRMGIAADAAAPAAQIISVESVVAGTTNTAGAAFTLIGSLGTSQGAPGRVEFKAGALIPGTGSTQQTAVSRLVLGASKVLINNTVTTLVNVTDANDTVAAGILFYAVEVFNGTDLQIEEGSVSFHLTNKAGTIANNTVVKAINQQAMTSGTLTVTFAISAANPALLSVNANSSLTPSTGYPRITYEIRNLTQQAIAVQ